MRGRSGSLGRGGLCTGADLVLDLTTLGLLGGLARFVLTTPVFLGGRQDRDLLLLAPLGLAPGLVFDLLGEHALADGDLGRGQRPSGARGGTASNNWLGRRAGHHRGDWRGAGRGRGRQCRPLLLYLNLHDLGAAMAEALPYGPAVDCPPNITPPNGAQR